jgi:hypothetical protein
MAEQLRRYGQWAGDEIGQRENITRCVQVVYPADGGWIPYQCKRKRGHGPNGLYCSQHGAIEDRRQRRAARRLE